MSKRFYIVKNCDEELVAVFTDLEDCKEFITDNYFARELGYTELVI